MRKNRLYSTLIGCLLASTLFAASRLTVVAVVDGLTADNLNALRLYWQQGGLRTLSEEAYQTTLAFPHLVYGGNETTATLMTGTTPSEHGYTMDRYFLRRDRKLHSMLEDEQAKGIGTEQRVSARALLSPTIADRMRLQYPYAKIYAVGLDAETSVLLAGHAANACCWLDADKQAWVATAAYSEGLPSAAYEMNQNGRIAQLAAHLLIEAVAGAAEVGLRLPEVGVGQRGFGQAVQAAADDGERRGRENDLLEYLFHGRHRF